MIFQSHAHVPPPSTRGCGRTASRRPPTQSQTHSRNLAFLATVLLCLAPGVEGATLYLDQSAGDDANDGLSLQKAYKTAKEAVKALKPGDELRIVGQLANPSYDPTYEFGDVSDAQLWHGENTLTIHDVHGTEDAWISIVSHDNNTVLRGDGSNVVRIQQSSYIKLENLNIYGEVERIPLETAKAVQFVYKDVKDNNKIKYRVDPSLSPEEIDALTLPKLGSNVPRVSYTDTRGVYVSDSHHIQLSGSHVHHVPGNGVRFAKSEFIYVYDNEVDNCARKSYSGTHALVATYTTDLLPRETDPNLGEEDYRVVIVRNRVHHNFNEIFSWVGTKPFIHAKIDEGKGISLQRNQEFRNGGRILVANNVAYWNGYSGIHSQDGDNVDMFSNTAYMNSWTNTKGEYKDEGEARGGNNIGISHQGGKDVRIVNNVVQIDTSWRGMPISMKDAQGAPVVSNNLVFGEGEEALKLDADFVAIATGTIEADPQFADSLRTFGLAPNSPAEGAASKIWAPCEDFYGNARSKEKPSIGAVEANCVNGACAVEKSQGVGLSAMAACYALNRDDHNKNAGSDFPSLPAERPPPQPPAESSTLPVKTPKSTAERKAKREVDSETQQEERQKSKEERQRKRKEERRQKQRQKQLRRQQERRKRQEKQLKKQEERRKKLEERQKQKEERRKKQEERRQQKEARKKKQQERQKQRLARLGSTPTLANLDSSTQLLPFALAAAAVAGIAGIAASRLVHLRPSAEEAQPLHGLVRYGADTVV